MHERRGIRPDPAAVEQAAVPRQTRQCGNSLACRPPIRGFLRQGLWPGHYLRLHGSLRLTAARATPGPHRCWRNSGCDSMLAAGRGGREWAYCMTIGTDVCAAHRLTPDAFRRRDARQLAACRAAAGEPGRRGPVVTRVRLAEQLADLDDAPAASFVVLSRAASAQAVDYRLDMALRWAAIHQVAAVAAFSAELWRPTLTSADIAERANIAMVSVPAGVEPHLAAACHYPGDRRRCRARARAS